MAKKENGRPVNYIHHRRCIKKAGQPHKEIHRTTLLYEQSPYEIFLFPLFQKASISHKCQLSDTNSQTALNVGWVDNNQIEQDEHMLTSEVSADE